MILVDANLLICAAITTMPHHSAAKTWLDGRFNEGGRVGLPWSSLTAFLRLTMNPRVLARPLMLTDAWSVAASWLVLPNVWIPRETEEHASIFASLLPHTSPGGNLIPDVHLAALAISHGLVLCSADGDFARFPSLRRTNPLLP